MLPIICIAVVLRLGHATGGARVSSTSLRHGRVASAVCCGMGWISAERGVWCNWSVAIKTGSMYPRRRWSLWTLAVTLLAWHSSCHTSQPAVFRATNIWRNATNLDSDEKVLHFTHYCAKIDTWPEPDEFSPMWIHPQSSRWTPSVDLGRSIMNNTVENYFSEFLDVKWLHLTVGGQTCNMFMSNFLRI